jgi:pseudouridine-5'-phosphate glycosidase
VSADLVELARTEVLVVAEAIKSLLEVPSTMEGSRDARRTVIDWRAGR